MTFQAIETSDQTAMPVELFQFNYSGRSWYATNAEQEITYLSSVYTPLPGITRGTFEENSDGTRSQLEIKVPMDYVIADLYRVTPPLNIITVTVFARQLTDTDNQFRVIWKGRLLNCQWDDQSMATLTSESIFSSLQRPGLAPLYSRRCRVPLYSEKCTVSRAANQLLSVTTAIAANVLTCTGLGAHASGYYAGGMVTWSSGSILAKRAIISHDAVAKTITINASPSGLAIGQQVMIFPGCDHTPQTCNGKYGNLINYQGEPLIPLKNPFGGSTTLF